ncbi:MAG: hypothetical protein IT288_09510 [Bdellovibrionales bacterium]|nr:hypothetical protein [Bdellovibrionales bacterium]
MKVNYLGWAVLVGIILGLVPLGLAGECRLSIISPDQVTQLLLGKSRIEFSQLSDRGEAWVEAFMQRARGVGVSSSREVPRSREVIDANNWIRTITESWAPNGESFVWLPTSQSHLGWARQVRRSRIVGVERLGGGTNGVLKVIQADDQGQRFQSIFKPLAQSAPVRDGFFETQPKEFLRFLFHVREVRAQSFYGRILESYWRHGGHAPIHVPETLEAVLVHEGKSYGVGSLQQWSMGLEVEAVRRQDPTRVAYWRGTREWQEMEVVVRVLDYLFGNSDRFPKKPDEEAIKNLMVEMRRDGDREVLVRANLIDNGLGVPGHRDFSIDQAPVNAHLSRALVLALHDVYQARQLMRRQEESYFPSWALDDLFARWGEIVNRYPNR